MSTAKTPILWVVALYAAAALAVFISISGVLSTGGWLPLLILVPMLGLLLPPLRNKVDPRERYLPGPKWSLGVAFVLLMFQAGLFGDHASGVEAEKEAKLQQVAAERAVTVKRGLSEEFARDKVQILGQVESLLASNRPKEAAALANKYFALSKDPDLARLKSRIDMAVMKLELDNEAAVPLARRAQIYKTLMQEEPGSFARYQGKLKEVTAALEAERQAAARAAEQAALEASIKSQFSPWDGSHRNVEAALKARMKNPKSYEHVETGYTVGGGSITVVTTYRGTNGFGAVVTNQAIATVDMAGNVLTLSTL
ncbi:MAG: hypothetical protein Q7U09_00215 [Hydrogenophaga sp.]|nr:hypothetical protein [Hydrogenophaga sp.]